MPGNSNRLSSWHLIALACACLLACAEPENQDAPWRPDELALLASLSPLPPLPPSPGNRFADDPRAVHLGHRLFFDTGMSANGKVACATCHQPERHFTDGRPLAQALGTTERHTPTLLGAPWLPYLFHDGRKDSVWAQALGPLEAEAEHGSSRLAIAHHVASTYRLDYEALFGHLPALDQLTRFPQHARPVPFGATHPHQRAWDGMAAADRQAVDRVFAHVGKALEAYQRKLLPQVAPFDRYVQAVQRGDAQGGGFLTVSARRGLRSFIGKAQCVNCHNGPLFTDRGFHNLGLPKPVGRSSFDVGRSLGAQQVKSDPFRCGQAFSDAKDCAELRFLDPKFEDFLGAFKTPTLRNVARTAPYMHAGQMADLDAVLTFYKTLPGKAEPGHRELVLALLDPEVSSVDLVAFLHSLTGPLPPAQWLQAPALPASTGTGGGTGTGAL